MVHAPTFFPEMRKIPCSDEIIREVDEAELSLNRQMEMLKAQCFKPRDRQEIVADTSLDNIGLALVATLVCTPLSMPAQWLLRQRFLRAGWDEIEFELNNSSSGYGERLTKVLLIEHKYKSAPRTRCMDDAEYGSLHEKLDKGRPG